MLVPIGAFVGAFSGIRFWFMEFLGKVDSIRYALFWLVWLVAAFFGGFNTILSVFYPDRVQGTVSWMAGGL